MMILLEVSRRCDRDCVGCYFDKKKDGNVLTEENFVDIFLTLETYKNTRVSKQIILHGAEVGHVDPEVLDSFLEKLRKIFPKSHLSVQTNAIDITSKHIDVFLKHNVSIGISYRGPKEIFSDIMRNGTYEEWREKVDMIRKKLRGKGLGGIFYYPTEIEDKVIDMTERIVDDIFNSGFRKMRLSEFTGLNPNKRFDEFAMKAKSYAVKKKYPIWFSPIDDFLKTIHGEFRLSCNWTHRCPDYIGVTLEGEVIICNRDVKRWKPFFRECLDCEIFGWCLGGCQHQRELTGSFPYCNQRKNIVRWVLDNRPVLFAFMTKYLGGDQ